MVDFETVLSISFVKPAEQNPAKQQDLLKKFHDYQRKAEVYYVYHVIQRYTVSFLLERMITVHHCIFSKV